MGQITINHPKPTHASLMNKSKSDLAYDLLSAYRFQELQDDTLKRVWAFIEEFEAEAKALPLGHEDEQRGKSTYNWMMDFVRRFKKAVL